MYQVWQSRSLLETVSVPVEPSFSTVKEGNPDINPPQRGSRPGRRGGSKGFPTFTCEAETEKEGQSGENYGAAGWGGNGHTLDETVEANRDTPVFCVGENGPVGETHSRDVGYLRVCSVQCNDLAAQGGILIDSGSTATVCGESWLHRSGIDSNNLTPSFKTFRFGDGRKCGSRGDLLLKMEVPIVTDGKRRFQKMCLQTEVVAEEIPMLLSRSTLTQMAENLRFGEANCVFQV